MSLHNIRPSSEAPKHFIDLTGPDGNVFNLIGQARRLAKQAGKNPDKITENMMSGDYDHAVEVFAKSFPSITLYR